MASEELFTSSNPPPGFIFVGIPERYQCNPLLAAGPYFTIPAPLLNEVVRQVGRERFDGELLEMEYALSEICGDHSSDVGFWRGNPINFLLLRYGSNLASDFFVAGLQKRGKTAEEAREILALAGERLNWTVEVRKGYCGWLMTNRDFLDEHQQIFGKWPDSVVQNGIPKMGPVVRDASAVPGVETGDAAIEELLRGFEGFFVRWRLEEMPAPFVPWPMGPHIPVTDLRPVLGHMRQGGTTFYFPDTCPIPSRDKLREILEEVIRKLHAPDHLAEWFDIVQSDNAAKNQIAHYGRLFEVQHYLRALYARHEAALRRKKSSLIVALSEFLCVSADTIERDLKMIADRAGQNWHLPMAD